MATTEYGTGTIVEGNKFAVISLDSITSDSMVSVSIVFNDGDNTNPPQIAEYRPGRTIGDSFVVVFLNNYKAPLNTSFNWMVANPS